MATMAVLAPGRDRATACCRSLVNVAMPQRRGSEFPMKAMRMDGGTVEPPAVVDGRPVGYENAQRRSMNARRKTPPNPKLQHSVVRCERFSRFRRSAHAGNGWLCSFAHRDGGMASACSGLWWMAHVALH